MSDLDFADHSGLILDTKVSDHIPTNLGFLRKLILALTQYRKYETTQRNSRIGLHDVSMIDTVITQAHYVCLIFSRFEDRRELMVPEEYNFTDDMDSLVLSFSRFVDGEESVPAMVNIVKASESLENIIHNYHNPVVVKSFWSRFFH